MNNIIFGLGLFTFSLGVCTADSENLIIPISLVTIGLIIMKLTYKKLI